MIFATVTILFLVSMKKIKPQIYLKMRNIFYEANYAMPIVFIVIFL